MWDQDATLRPSAKLDGIVGQRLQHVCRSRARHRASPDRRQPFALVRACEPARRQGWRLAIVTSIVQRGCNLRCPSV